MSLIAELKRRNVFRVGVAYAIVAWLLIEVASVILPTFKAPEWVMQVFTFLLILGFPIALVFAWAFELTLEGVKRESAVDPDESITHITGRKLDFAIIGLLAIAVVFMFVDNYLPETEPEQAEVAAEQAPAAEAVAREKSIAVLPFSNMSGDPEQEYFSDGITEELIHTLTAIEGLQVAGRTSSFSFKGKDVDLPTIGEALGVSNLLEGSVRRSGNQLRITAQLINAADGFHLWSHNYDRELADIFEIQEEIARDIAKALRIELDASLPQPLGQPGTSGVEAHDAILRGIELRDIGTAQSLKQALAWFERAATLDPDFEWAHVEIGSAYADLLGRGAITPKVAEEPARAAIDRALELNPNSSDAYTARGFLEESLGNVAAAEASYQAALDLNPNNGWAHLLYGQLLSQSLSRPEEAVQHLERTVAIDPLWPLARSTLGLALGASGQTERAILLLRSSIETDPDFVESYYILADLYGWGLARIDEAIRWEVRAAELSTDSWLREVLVRHYLNLGDPAGAAAWLSRLESNALDHDHHLLTSRYFLQRYRGESKQALETARLLGMHGQHVAGFHFVGDLAWLRDLQSVDSEAALAGYARVFPEIAEDPPVVNTNNYAAAVSIAILHLRAGDEAAAERLLRESLAAMETMPVMGVVGHGNADVMAYLVLGETEQAAASLQHNLAAGWRVDWWLLRVDPVFEPLWGLPEFQALMSEVEAEMAAQLARVREMERNGELEPIPEIPATAH
jgi:TolB-like protein/tetratricopeptide (TPR) repeat protein